MARGATDPAGGAVRGEAETRRLGLLLAAAMFVLVIDTSLMNVSISYVVRDLDSWTISENLRPASDKYTAKRKGQSVRWRF